MYNKPMLLYIEYRVLTVFGGRLIRTVDTSPCLLFFQGTSGRNQIRSKFKSFSVCITGFSPLEMSKDVKSIWIN